MQITVGTPDISIYQQSLVITEVNDNPALNARTKLPTVARAADGTLPIIVTRAIAAAPPPDPKRFVRVKIKTL